jgi:hypothetical protein
MTQNIKSVQLTLMIGSAVATAAPREVIDALEEVEVQVEDTEASGFQMTFSVDKQSPLEILRLLAGGLLFVRVVLVATVNGFVNVPRRQGFQLNAHRHRQRPDSVDGSFQPE